MELFVHSVGKEHPDIVEIGETAPVRTLLVEEDGQGHVWLEEVDEELDLDVTLKDAGVQHYHHVHRGRCHCVQVVVRWNGNHERAYAPATTITTVEQWAFGPEVANLSPEQAAKHVLAEPGADHFLEGGAHVGSLVKPGSCSVILDLLPRARFAGEAGW